MKIKITILLTLIAFSLISVRSFAIPAYPKPIKVTQPDGTTVTLKLVGDEFSHKTFVNGVECRQDANGFWVEASKNVTKSGLSSGPKMTRSNASPKLSASGTISGNKKFLVLLVEFSDVKMTYGNENFKKMMNENGYSDFNSTGSVKDYFFDNSSGLFTPQFDVVGPITLPNSCAYYGADDKDKELTDIRAYEALKDACEIAHAKGLVNFSNYDLDSDGKVDNVYFYYAGHSQAEGGGDNTIWPHAWYLSSGAGVTLRLDGKLIDRYACSSELSSYTGKNMSGIGAFCHEFSHVIGLPDLYDTDYEKSGGTAETVSYWSLMDCGAYLNGSKTPPYYIGFERERLGWGSLTFLNTEGQIEIEPIHNNKSYYTNTDTSGEIFVYEYRDGTGWDKYLPKGLAIFHLDASKRDVNGETAYSRWTSGNGINEYYYHPCCYIVPSIKNYSSLEDIPFPGSGSVRSFEGVGWSKARTGRKIENIRIEGNSVKANLSLNISKKVSGTVYGSDGNPIEGADISMTIAESSTKSSLSPYIQRSLKASSNSDFHTTSAADGSYSIDLKGVEATNFNIVVSCRGYFGQTEDITVPSDGLSKDFILNTINYSGISKYNLYKFKPSTIAEAVYVLEWQSDAVDDYAIGVKFKASELTNLVGARVDSILFGCPAKEITEASVTIDAGTRNKILLNKKINTKDYVANGYTRVCLTEENFTVPSGKDLVFGFRIKGNKEKPFALLSTDKVQGGMMYSYDNYDWYEYESGCALIVVKFSKIESSVSSAGINVISVPSELKAGNTLTLSLIENEKPSSVKWKYDGNDVSDSVTLSSGEHLITAELTYSNGVKETIERWIKVN